MLSRVEIIQKDARHCDVRLLVERQAAARGYATWSMGYLHNLDLEDELKAALCDPVPSGSLVDVMARMQPDTGMGALR